MITKKSKYIISISIFLIFILLGVLYFVLSHTDNKIIGQPPDLEHPIIMYDSHRFVFIGTTTSLVDSEVEILGEVKKEVSKFPINNNEAHKVEVGETIYGLKIITDKSDMYPYIFIKDTSNNAQKDTYIIGLPYYQDTNEKAKVSEYMRIKNEEYQNYRQKK